MIIVFTWHLLKNIYNFYTNENINTNQKLYIIMVIQLLSILFAVLFGITALLSRRISVVKAQSQNEVSSDYKNLNSNRLLLFIAFWYQWFIIGYPCTRIASLVEVHWIVSLFNHIAICSLLFQIIGAVVFMTGKRVRKARLSLRVANWPLEFVSWAFGLAMCALIIVIMCG